MEERLPEELGRRLGALWSLSLEAARSEEPNASD
jgi:hypothetical protein